MLSEEQVAFNGDIHSRVLFWGLRAIPTLQVEIIPSWLRGARQCCIAYAVGRCILCYFFYDCSTTDSASAHWYSLWGGQSFGCRLPRIGKYLHYLTSATGQLMEFDNGDGQVAQAELVYVITRLKPRALLKHLQQLCLQQLQTFCRHRCFPTLHRQLPSTLSCN